LESAFGATSVVGLAEVSPALGWDKVVAGWVVEDVGNEKEKPPVWDALLGIDGGGERDSDPRDTSS